MKPPRPTLRRAVPRLSTLTLLTALLLPAGGADARVKLITLPVRDRVEIRLDHDHATLIEEERTVPLVPGTNQVDFSWANTQINPATLVFRVLDDDGHEMTGDDAPVKVLSVTYPPGENALVWQVSSSKATSARVRISYLLGGLTRDFSYRARVSHDEKTLTLNQYVNIRNFAGEAYGDTQISIGTGDADGGLSKPLGLNESKQVRTQRFVDLPVTKTYTADFHRFGYLDAGEKKLRVPMHYRLSNTAEAGLGDAALPKGKVRIFQEDSPGPDATTAFLGEDVATHTPVGRHADLFLGVAQDVVVRRTVETKDDRRIAGNLMERRVTLKYVVENFKDTPVTLRLAEQIDALRRELSRSSGQPASWSLGTGTTLPSEPLADETDAGRVTFEAPLAARAGDTPEPQTFFLEIVFDNQW